VRASDQIASANREKTAWQLSASREPVRDLAAGFAVS